MIFSKKASVQWKVDDWLDLNSKQEGVRLVWFRYQKGYDWLDLNSKQEGVRLVRFKYQKGYDWLNSQFHCSHLESRGVPEKPREKKRGKLSPFHFRWRHFRWCNFRSRLRTRSLPTPPHSTPSNTVWAVPIYYSWTTFSHNVGHIALISRWDEIKQEYIYLYL